MLTGIELILKRMESHPEEFVGVRGGCSKEWHAVIAPAVAHLTDEEKEALSTALTKAHRDHLNAQVMKKIAGEDVMSDREKVYADEDYYGRSLPELLRKSQEETTATLGAMEIRPRPLVGSTLRGAQPYPQTIAGSNGTAPSAFGAVPVKQEGTAVNYATFTHKSYP